MIANDFLEYMAVQRPKNLRITDLRIHGISSHLASVRPFEECQAKDRKKQKQGTCLAV